VRAHTFCTDFHTEAGKQTASRIEHELYHVRMCANQLVRQQALLAHALEQLWIDEQVSRARAELDSVLYATATSNYLDLHYGGGGTAEQRLYIERLQRFIQIMSRRRMNIAFDCGEWYSYLFESMHIRTDIERIREREEDAELTAEMQAKIHTWRQTNAMPPHVPFYNYASAARHPALRCGY
jgi:hypothetical protein